MKYALLSCWTLLSFASLALAGDADKSPSQFTFRDVGEASGLFPALEGIQGHAAGWGDVDGNGSIDLYVGTFFDHNGKPNVLMRNSGGKFVQDEQPQLGIPSCATGTLFADWDNDGDLDLYVSSMPRPKKDVRGCAMFENQGGGKFAEITDKCGACPAEFGGRSATVLDFDGDGLLDVLVGEDPLPGYNGSPTKSSRLFRNLGGLKFADVSREVGLPADIPGLGVAAADVNNDGWPDFFLAAHNGGNRLLVNDGHGKFHEPAGSREVFHWEGAKGDNMVCGICFGDVNRDGLLDIVLGQHFKTPWVAPVASRLYLNRGVRDGEPVFENVSESAGIIPLPLKAPHVEIQDYDNDGWPDLSVSIVKFSGDKAYPIIFKHTGVKDGLPQFVAQGLTANDYPTADDRAVKSTGAFFKKMIDEGKVIYTAPGPTGDFDNDGRLDMFMPSWWPERRSLLMRNETTGGNWLQVEVRGPKGVNRMGVGTRLCVYPAGKLGDRSSLIGCREIASGFGYASAQPAIAHFGLGELEKVDIEIIWPHGKGKIERKGVATNQRLVVEE